MILVIREEIPSLDSPEVRTMNVKYYNIYLKPYVLKH